MGLLVNRYTQFMCTILADIKKCGAGPFVYYHYLTKKCKFDTKGGRFRMLNKPSISIAPNAELSIGSTFDLNIAYPKRSGKKAVLVMEKCSRLRVVKRFQMFYDGEIWLYPNSELCIGSGYMNSGGTNPMQRANHYR